MNFPRIMRPLLWGIIIAAGALLVACIPAPQGASANYTNEDYFFEIHKPLSDGRTVQCLGQASGNGYALSCDWANAR